MEIKATLKQPYSDEEHLAFIVEQNHQLGYEIRQIETTSEVEEQIPYTEIVTETISHPVLDDAGEPVLDNENNPLYHEETIKKEVTRYKTETVVKTLYNLEAWGFTDEEKAQEERKRVAMLNRTAADVERAIYKAKGMDFDDVLALVEAQPVAEGETPTIDIKALKIELKANNFYRGNPYVETVGTLLGISADQLDRFFETGDYTELVAPVEVDSPENSESSEDGADADVSGSAVESEIQENTED